MKARRPPGSEGGDDGAGELTGDAPKKAKAQLSREIRTEIRLGGPIRQGSLCVALELRYSITIFGLGGKR